MKLIASSWRLGLLGWILLLWVAVVQAQPGPTDSTGAASQPETPQRRWVVIPRVPGRLRSEDLGVVINSDDPYSVQVGDYYVKARGIRPEHVLRVSLPVKPVLKRGEFEELSRQIRGFFGSEVQALALAWRFPYAVECNSITGALTMGFDPQLCINTCAPSRSSPYF
ncbi:MAG TPA: hypothetical protein VFM48_01490 [Aquabacterium sp.]|nr:hypothetical protein [Aquabacterium sp.]